MPSQKATLTIDLPNTHNVITFKPPSTPQFSRTTPNYRTQDPTELRGSLELYLPSKRQVKSIKVGLKNVEEIIINGKPTRRLVLNEELLISVNELMHQGVHKYEFSFILDTRTPTYERHSRGGTLQYLEALVEFDEIFSKSLLHKMPLIFVGHPNSEGSFIPFEHIHQDYVEDIGPLEVSFKTQHLTIAGYILIEIYLPSPVPGLEIRGVKVSLEQHTTIHDEEKVIEKLPVNVNVLLDEGGKTDCIIRAPEHDSVIEGRYFVRLPKDDDCRPSTLDWSLARLRQAHFLVVDMLYKREKLKMATVKIPLVLPQCLLSADSIALPTYTDTGYPVPSKRHWEMPLPQHYINCSCGKDDKSLKADAEGANNPDTYVPSREGIWISDLRTKEESIPSRDSYEEIRAAKRVNEYY